MMTTTTATVTDAETSLKTNGKTFHWARRFLGPQMGHDAARLYAVCRLLDDLADGDLPDGPERLTAIHQSLSANTATTDPDLAQFLPFMAEKSLPHDVVVALIDGLIMDQQEVALITADDVVRYGYHVAGTVGLMMCRILDCEDDNAYGHAIDLGVAMQLTNIARDVLEDAHMGRRYLPADWCEGMTADDITRAAMTNHHDGIAVVRGGVQKLLGLAEAYYASGITGLNYLPLRAHLAILIAARAYRQSGIQLARQGTRWHQGRTVTSTATKAITTCAALPMMARRLTPPADHQKSLHTALEGLPYARA
ncbi:MAG: squalene/phytoene synthase family protein [Alphaproteobacteria bacterium]|nr:squalene/phytoene synthase family protein [Alphaproteobacteria bacterium]